MKSLAGFVWDRVGRGKGPGRESHLGFVNCTKLNLIGKLNRKSKSDVMSIAVTASQKMKTTALWTLIFTSCDFFFQKH